MGHHPAGLHMLNEKTLKDKLEHLQCQFTWKLEKNDKINIHEILQTLEIKIHHSTCLNLSTLYNLKAYLLHQQQRSSEALQCLQQAEQHVAIKHKAHFDQHVIVTYGNYAWIYYFLNNFQECEDYLQKVHDICSKYPDKIQHLSIIFAEQAWSFLEVGIRNGKCATRYFKKALDISPDESSCIGLAYATYAHAIYSQDTEVMNQAVKLLDKILHKDPANCEARVYLAKILQEIGHRKDKNRARKLLADDFQGYMNPEVLRILSGLNQIITFDKCFEILQRAKCIAPDYHKLTHEMGHIYRHKAYSSRDAEKSNAIEEASKWYTLAIQLMPWNVEARLDLANMYGEKYHTAFEGIIYSQISNEIESLSKICKQRFYLQYGIYNLYKIHHISRGISLLQSGFKINPTSKYGIKCKKGLTLCTILHRSTEAEIDGFINNVEDAKRQKHLK
ncbi:hypothetical protein GDO81_016122 [Engystomops pustulosus]|uniref:Interferon-induced protein with tetratricopeptide repeats 5 n=1 Tax=Engystomops pustulosus TaxID=76066 RepID=A0AAV7AW76_ENGPU|nr:hypothetical protein GDO81_016122 [Engystomops pustulosus]